MCRVMSKGILDKQKSDVEIVRSSWEQLKAEIKPDRAMTSFLYETLDKGGADICLAAFELQRTSLPGGETGCEAVGGSRR